MTGRSVAKEAESLTAREWCKKYNLTAAKNAGMFARDHSTPIGYPAVKKEGTSSHVNGCISVAAFNSRPV
ncbi:hypothetical protein GX408_01625 [bacterium]|nr:hypothetical protein [bacterium]